MSVDGDPLVCLEKQTSPPCKTRLILTPDGLQFVPWKKLYHKVKVGEASAVSHISHLMQRHGMTCRESYLISLVRFVPA